MATRSSRGKRRCPTFFSNSPTRRIRSARKCGRRSGRNDLDAAAPQPGGRRMPGHLDLPDRVGCQRYADGIADAVQEQAADAQRRADAARQKSAGFGHAQVERVWALRVGQAVGGPRFPDVVRLQRDLQVEKCYRSSKNLILSSSERIHGPRPEPDPTRWYFFPGNRRSRRCGWGSFSRRPDGRWLSVPGCRRYCRG